jgi:hypothetical protein
MEKEARRYKKGRYAIYRCCIRRSEPEVRRWHPAPIPQGQGREEDEMIVDFDLLVRETADVFGVTPEDILGPKRTKHVSMARHVVMACWADHHPYQDTADRCNRTCHSTVIWARQRILNEAEMDVSFAKMLAAISNRCQFGAEQEPEKKEKQIEICA